MKDDEFRIIRSILIITGSIILFLVVFDIFGMISGSNKSISHGIVVNKYTEPGGL
jgi:hypothetical protein